MSKSVCFYGDMIFSIKVFKNNRYNKCLMKHNKSFLSWTRKKIYLIKIFVFLVQNFFLRIHLTFIDMFITVIYIFIHYNSFVYKLVLSYNIIKRLDKLKINIERFKKS